MKRLFMILAIGALSLSVAPTVVATQPQAVAITVHAVLIGDLTASTTTGTFTTTGAMTTSGSEHGSGTFAGQGHLRTGNPNSLHSELDLADAGGSVTIALQGLVGQLPALTANGSGRWVVAGATGAYSGLHGEGSFTMVADFHAAFSHTGPPTVAIELTGQIH